MTGPTVRLIDVTTRLGSGITPRGGAAAYKTSGRPFVRSQNVGWGELRLADLAYIDDATHGTFASTEVREGDVLLNITGASIGRCAVATAELDGGNVNQHVCEIRLKPGVMDPYFVNAVLLSRIGQDQIAAFQAGGNRQGLNFQQVGSIRIPDISIEQQRMIGAALRDADHSVAALERLIVKKRAIKKGLVQQLLTGVAHLPGYADDMWKEWRLSELLRRPPRYGINAAASPLTSGFPTYIRITDIDDSGKFSPRPKVGVKHPRSSDYKLGDGELVFARTGASVGKSYLYDPRDGELVYAGFLINIAPDPQRLNPKYFSLFAQTKEYWNWVARTSVRSGQPGINGREYAQLTFSAPGIETQSAIADVVSGIDDEIDALGRCLSKAQLVRLGMMQELLGGRVCLPVQGEGSE
ncbi:hypothetical protein ACF1AU_03675 [Streptomyces rubrogriseus]|uniref:hypothetical protein n=1 Tax=Streptomyces rubrogriseus TaxID=194673 RepID=UPI0036FFD80E